MKPFLVLFSVLLSSPAAHAGLVGNPVATPAQGRFAAEVLFDWENQVVVDQGCTSEGDATTSGCEAVRAPMTGGVRLDIHLLRGLGVFGDVALFTEDMKAAAYTANGLTGGAGVRVAWPVWNDWNLAAVGQWEMGTGRRHFFAPTEDAVPGAQAVDVAWQRTRVAVLAAWAPQDGTFFLYAGPSYAPWYVHTAAVADDNVDFTFAPAQRLGGVAGVELRSDHLGLPWTNRQNRLSVGGEIRTEGGLGFGLRTGLSF